MGTFRASRRTRPTKCTCVRLLTDAKTSASFSLSLAPFSLSPSFNATVLKHARRPPPPPPPSSSSRASNICRAWTLRAYRCRAANRADSLPETWYKNVFMSMVRVTTLATNRECNPIECLSVDINIASSSPVCLPTNRNYVSYAVSYKLIRLYFV